MAAPSFQPADRYIITVIDSPNRHRVFCIYIDDTELIDDSSRVNSWSTAVPVNFDAEMLAYRFQAMLHFGPRESGLYEPDDVVIRDIPGAPNSHDIRRS